MSLAHMEVFNKYIMPATIETLAQKVEQFNAASGNAIMLTTEGMEGDFFHESFFKSLATAQRRVDRYTANVAAPVTDLSQEKITAVKVAGGFGPVKFEPSQLTWLLKSPLEATEVISKAVAEGILADQLNTSISALAAAIGNNANVTHDVSATSDIGHLALNGSHAKFGDHSGSLITSVMSGAHMHKIIGANISNDQVLFRAGDVRVLDILGKLIVVTDAPALTVGTKSKVLTLVSNAATVYDGADLITNLHTPNGNLRIETTFQADYAYMLRIHGYSWDEVNGGKSPTDAKLGTGANWLNVMTSNKHTAGVIAIGDNTKAAV